MWFLLNLIRWLFFFSRFIFKMENMFIKNSLFIKRLKNFALRNEIKMLNTKNNIYLTCVSGESSVTISKYKWWAHQSFHYFARHFYETIKNQAVYFKLYPKASAVATTINMMMLRITTLIIMMLRTVTLFIMMLSIIMLSMLTFGIKTLDTMTASIVLPHSQFFRGKC